MKHWLLRLFFSLSTLWITSFTWAQTDIPVAATEETPLSPAPVQREKTILRLGDLSSFFQSQDLALRGYGLVAGLGGRGDSQLSPELQDLKNRLMKEAGLLREESSPTTLPSSTTSALNETTNTTSTPSTQASLETPQGPAPSTRNSRTSSSSLALVALTATLDSHNNLGNRFPVDVASLGDVRSLEGGVLIYGTLFDTAGQSYAKAQGNLIIDRRGRNKTSASIPDGAFLEKTPPFDPQKISLILAYDDPTLLSAAQKALSSISEIEVQQSSKRQLDIQLNNDDTAANSQVLASIKALELPDYPNQNVVIDRQTGVVLAGGHITVEPIVLSLRGASISLQTETSSFSSENLSEQFLSKAATLEEFFKEVQSLGLSTDQLSTILLSMQKVGAIQARIHLIDSKPINGQAGR